MSNVFYPTRPWATPFTNVHEETYLFEFDQLTHLIFSKFWFESKEKVRIKCTQDNVTYAGVLKENKAARAATFHSWTYSSGLIFPQTESACLYQPEIVEMVIYSAEDLWKAIRDDIQELWSVCMIRKTSNRKDIISINLVDVFCPESGRVFKKFKRHEVLGAREKIEATIKAQEDNFFWKDFQQEWLTGKGK